MPQVHLPASETDITACWRRAQAQVRLAHELDRDREVFRLEARDLAVGLEEDAVRVVEDDLRCAEELGLRKTFLERDIPQLGITIPAVALQRFWNMVAHYHGQIWNAAELARALAINESTVRRYLDLMAGVFMVRQLPPWFENLGKRQVKAPKVYVRDTGLLHALLGIANQRDLELHPKVGASWEGYAVEEVLKALRPDEAYFWATHQGAELDLLLFKHGRRIGIECKRADAPTLTPSMRIALADLKLDELRVVYPGRKRYTLAKKVEVMPLAELVGAN